MKKVLLTLLILPLYCTVNTKLKHPDSHPCCQNAELYVYQVVIKNATTTPVMFRTVKASCVKSMVEQEMECGCNNENIYCEWICQN